MKNHQVVIAGAGPTGMMLGAELKIAGVDVVVLERRPTPELSGARAGGGGMHARTLEVLDQRGVVDRFMREGYTAQTTGFNGVMLDLSDFPTRHNYGLALWQKHSERILAGWVDEIGVNVVRDVEMTGFTQDDNGVTVKASDGSTLRAQYLVGCDGGRSLVRKTLGIPFPGSEPTMSWLIAQVQMTDEPAFGFKFDSLGRHAMGKTATEGTVGVVLVEPTVRPTTERTIDDLREGLIRVYGKDFGVHSPTYISSFTDGTRQASEYRKGRVLLAGDAAHIHAPLGGQGLNLGMQDAVNLGWKLAQVVKGISPDSLLDTYQAERHPVAARVLKNILAHVAAMRLDDRSKALSDYFVEFLKMDGPRKAMAGELSALAIRYDLGEGHPLLGRRMPDLDIVTASGPTRVFALLHEARPLLINFGEHLEAGNLVRVVDAKYEGAWELPVIGSVPAPSAVLVRPDGYVAWTGDGTAAGLAAASQRWFGK